MPPPMARSRAPWALGRGLLPPAPAASSAGARRCSRWSSSTRALYPGHPGVAIWRADARRCRPDRMVQRRGGAAFRPRTRARRAPAHHAPDPAPRNSSITSTRERYDEPLVMRDMGEHKRNITSVQILSLRREPQARADAGHHQGGKHRSHAGATSWPMCRTNSKTPLTVPDRLPGDGRATCRCPRKIAGATWT